MATTTYHSSIAADYTRKVSGTSVFTKFLNWCKDQQDNRLLWLGFALAGHGCILTPITVFAIALSGNSLVLLILALVAMSLTLVTNLAAMPTRITIPVFLFSAVVDISILLACTSIGFNLAKVF